MRRVIASGGRTRALARESETAHPGRRRQSPSAPRRSSRREACTRRPRGGRSARTPRVRPGTPRREPRDRPGAAPGTRHTEGGERAARKEVEGACDCIGPNERLARQQVMPDATPAEACPIRKAAASARISRLEPTGGGRAPRLGRLAGSRGTRGLRENVPGGVPGYAPAAAKRKRQGCRPAADPDVLLAQLCSAYEQVRVKALHRVCPCGAGFLLYERFRGEVKRLQKDPSPPRTSKTSRRAYRSACGPSSCSCRHARNDTP